MRNFDAHFPGQGTKFFIGSDVMSLPVGSELFESYVRALPWLEDLAYYKNHEAVCVRHSDAGHAFLCAIGELIQHMEHELYVAYGLAVQLIRKGVSNG